MRHTKRKGEIDVGKKLSPAFYKLTSNEPHNLETYNLINKPIEIYAFIDPFCPNSWSLEGYLKKLIVEYGSYFKLRAITSGNLYSINPKVPKRSQSEKRKNTDKFSVKSNDSEANDQISSMWEALLALKAAELQGRRVGLRFLRKMQEYYFLNKEDISNHDVLIEIAEGIKIDIAEFKKDLNSKVAKRALQRDLNLAYEMEIDVTPALVFFNLTDDEDGIKVAGLYDYEVYVDALFEVLKKKVKPAFKPALIDFIAQFSFVETNEVAVIYNWSVEQAEKELKKLLIAQKVKHIRVNQGSFWEYISDR